MAELALVDLDVLRQPSSAPNHTGLQVWRGLAGVMNAALVLPEGFSQAAARSWLADQRLELPPYVFSGADVIDHVRIRLRLPITLRVTQDAGLAAEAVRAGVTTLLLACPSFHHPEFRPDYERPVKSWDALVGELAEQRALAARVALEDDVPSA